MLSTNIAIEYYFLKCSSEACQHAKNAIRLLEKMRIGSDIEKHRIGFLEERIDIYKLMVELCIALNKKCEAYEYVKQSKSRALMDLVSTVEIAPLSRCSNLFKYLKK